MVTVRCCFRTKTLSQCLSYLCKLFLYCEWWNTDQKRLNYLLNWSFTVLYSLTGPFVLLIFLDSIRNHVFFCYDFISIKWIFKVKRKSINKWQLCFICFSFALSLLTGLIQISFESYRELPFSSAKYFWKKWEVYRYFTLKVHESYRVIFGTFLPPENGSKNSIFTWVSKLKWPNILNTTKVTATGIL